MIPPRPAARPPGRESAPLGERLADDAEGFRVKDEAGMARVLDGVVRDARALPARVCVGDDELIEIARDGGCLHPGGKALLVQAL